MDQLEEKANEEAAALMDEIGYFPIELMLLFLLTWYSGDPEYYAGSIATDRFHKAMQNRNLGDANNLLLTHSRRDLGYMIHILVNLPPHDVIAVIDMLPPRFQAMLKLVKEVAIQNIELNGERLEHYQIEAREWICENSPNVKKI